jgi:D-alanine--poly(phosphoribitol) ligase subunit 1
MAGRPPPGNRKFAPALSILTPVSIFSLQAAAEKGVLRGRGGPWEWSVEGMNGMRRLKNSVVHRFLASARRYSDRPALWTRDRTWSYAELSALAESLRQVLEGQGLHGPQRIGILTSDGAPTYAAILAVLANGSAYVPINSKHPVARNLGIIEEAGITALVYEAADDLVASVAEARGTGCQLIQATDSPSSPGLRLRMNWSAEPPLAYLLFTSGSTGKPKGVPIRHENLNAFMDVMVEGTLYDFRARDRFLQMFELTFDLSVMSFFVPLCVGASCYVIPESRFAAATALKVLQEFKITVALMVPSMLVFLESHLEKRIRLPHLRRSLFCGEALPDSLVQKWRLAAPNSAIENVYGPTEATIFCLRYPWDPESSPGAAVNGIVPIGVPLPGTGALLMDEQGRALAGSGSRGELLLTGAQLAAGYWKEPAKTAAAFITLNADDGETAQAYRTGDLCSINERGEYLYHGRLDSQVKIEGHRVELGEVEHHVRTILGRANVAVVAAADRNRHALLLVLEEPEIDRARLSTELALRLPDYMIPRRLEYLPHLPLNLNGKIDRAGLARLLEDHVS